MIPNPHSPNWYWQRLGYTVERYGKTGVKRRILDRSGGVVCDNVGHEEEVAIGRRLLAQEMRQKLLIKSEQAK